MGPSNSQSDSIGPIVDHETLREHDDVPYHDETDVVDTDTVEWMADADDMAAVGVTNGEGDLLLRRLTETCAWKIPVETVDSDDDFAAAITDHVRETIGFDLELDGIAGVWDVTVRTEDGSQSASRAFVTFSATPAAGAYDLDAVSPAGDPVVASDWFGALPENAQTIPGTESFLD
jgi:hypothetical protein